MFKRCTKQSLIFVQKRYVDKTPVMGMGVARIPELTRAPRRKWNRNRLGKTRIRSGYQGFLGHGTPISNPKRRWRGGRYNYFDWETLVKCINNCPSVIERDRMPNKQELNYFYRGAEKGVMHHGGFDVVAQILNLSPPRRYVLFEFEYPTWVEELQVQKKANEIQNLYNGKAIGPPHHYELPSYLRSIDQKIKNIQGKTISRNDKRRVMRKIYSKLNSQLYEQDKQRRLTLQDEWKEYKKKVRNEKILNEFENNMNFGYQETKDGFFKRLSPVESQKIGFDPRMYTVGDQHINLLDKNETHVKSGMEAVEAKLAKKSIVGRLSRMKNKLPFIGKNET